MKPEPFVTFDLTAMSPARVPKAHEARSLSYETYQDYLKEFRKIAKAKRFNLGESFKIVFILPYKEDARHLDGDPHLTGKHTLVKLVEGVRQALRPDEDIARVDASKYWGERGKIIIRNITVPDFDYLRQIK